jgi:hypothetical protein
MHSGDCKCTGVCASQVLRFSAFFQEPVPDSPEERWRIRKCQILHYLEDGSTQIDEPHEDNSGLTQGTLLRRHRCFLTNVSWSHGVKFYICRTRVQNCQTVLGWLNGRKLETQRKIPVAKALFTLNIDSLPILVAICVAYLLGY